MDKNQITTLVINAVVTIVTVAVVTRLSLNKGTLGIKIRLKERFTPKAIAYIALVLCVFLFALNAWALFGLLRKAGPPSRFEVFQISSLSIGGLIWSVLTGFCSGVVVGLRRKPANPTP